MKPTIWCEDGIWICACINFTDNVPKDPVLYSKWAGAGAGHTPKEAFEEWMIEVTENMKWTNTQLKKY